MCTIEIERGTGYGLLTRRFSVPLSRGKGIE
jgi:hypothetical protein